MANTEIDITGLDHIGDYSVPLYSSPGGDARARAIGVRTQQVLDWLGSLVELPPLPPLFVLDTADWDRIALVPQYGLAHVNRTRIVMGMQNSGLWTAVADDAWADLSEAHRRRMADVYGTPPDLGLFADLVIAHELTHLADRPGWLDDASIGPRNWGARERRLLWLNELVANIGLQGYITEREPESLPALETVFEIIGGTTFARFPFRRLSDMHASVAAPGADGTNYVWFQFRLLILAKRLWRAAGAAGFKRLQEVLHGPVLPDDAIFGVLAELDPAVARDVRQWA